MTANYDFQHNILRDTMESFSSRELRSIIITQDQSRAEKIFYDAKTMDGQEGYRIVLDACITDDHHDIISYYDGDSLEYTVRVMFDEERVPYISVDLLVSGDTIVIENGSWCFIS